MTDEFVDALAAALMEPLPVVGSIVEINGRRGCLHRVEYPYTCTAIYYVWHSFDGETVRYYVNDWDPNKPKVELVA